MLVHILFEALHDLRLVLNMKDFEGFVETTRAQNALDSLECGFLNGLLAEATRVKKMSIILAGDYARWHAMDLVTVVSDHQWEFTSRFHSLWIPH